MNKRLIFGYAVVGAALAGALLVADYPHKLSRAERVAAARSAEAANPPLYQEAHISKFKLYAYASADKRDIHFMLWNGSGQTVTDMVVKVQLMRGGEVVDNSAALFHYLDDGKMGDDSVYPHGDADRIDAVIVREVETCKLGKDYYKDCGDFVEGGTVANGLPVSVR